MPAIKPARPDKPKACVEHLRRNTWKAFRVRAESRELESGRTDVNQLSHSHGTFIRIDGRVERKIDARLRSSLCCLGPKAVGRCDQSEPSS